MSWILTHSGKVYDYLKPDENIDIEDIASALSRICRFTGHSRSFYSVATHSVLVSYLVPPSLAFEALMHDAHEAYIGDVNAPLKSLLPDYRDIEADVESCVRRHFGLPGTMHPLVKKADRRACTIERSILLPDHPDWPAEVGALRHDFLDEDNPKVACRGFLSRFRELTA